ncbi:MAG: FAD-dependent oxidoreductase [Thermomicrobiales bacterium]
MIDKHPALIARCTGTADVVEAVKFAAAHDLLVAVRGGGHNVAGNALVDDGLVIDLSPMTGVEVDPQSRLPVSNRAPTGESSIVRHNCSGWQRPAVRSRRPGWLASPSEAGWAICAADGDWPAII